MTTHQKQINFLSNNNHYRGRISVNVKLVQKTHKNIFIKFWVDIHEKQISIQLESWFILCQYNNYITGESNLCLIFCGRNTCMCVCVYFFCKSASG